MDTKVMKQYIFLILCLAFGLQSGYSQTVDQWIKAGDRASSKADYYAAFRYYEVALQYDSTRIDVWNQYAESARQFDAYNKAAKAYEKVVGSPQGRNFPKAAFWLAQCKQRLGQYESAEAFYRQYIDDQPNISDADSVAAMKGIADCIWADSIAQHQSDIVIVNLGDKINSPYSDIAPAFRGDEFYYSAYRFIDDRDTANPPRTFFKILKSVEGAEGQPISDLTLKEGVHAAHTSFNKDYTMVYFNLCEYEDQNKIRCDVYRSPVSVDGKWGDPVKLDINLPGFTTTQPSIGVNGQTGQEILYFSSDRPGGKGHMDLWYSLLDENGKPGQPMNLGPLNTAGNDVTPFWYTPTQTLYFSTDGRPTLGGYDIYESHYLGERWSAPENMGIPVNSSYDDQYFILNPYGYLAYLASKRPHENAIFWDDTKDACCFDLYYQQRDVLVLDVFTFNNEDKSPLPGTVVELIEILPNGDEKLVSKLYNADGNDFFFPLERGKKYKVRGSKEEFSPDMAIIDTRDPKYKDQTRIRQDLFLDPGIRLDVLTFRKIDSLALNGATVEVMELTPDGNIPVGIAENTPGNKSEFIVQKGKRYVIKGTRPGFIGPQLDTLDLIDPKWADVTSIERRLYFPQTLEIRTFDAKNHQPLAGVTIEIMTFAPTGLDSLSTRTNFEDNKFLYSPFDLERNYFVQASRPGYLPFVIDNLKIPEKEIIDAGGEIVLEIELQRKSIVEMLPISLYYDNDRPDPRTLNITTDKEYVQTYELYYAKKDEFLNEFTQGRTEQEKFRETTRFNDFFDREVKKGRDALDVFAEELLVVLKDNSSVTLTLMGYASPRATAPYNFNLSKRRIDCVKNYFEDYLDGALVPYMSSGKLKFKEEPYGESTANLDEVSDKLNDPRNSVYSIRASVERRVEIKKIDIKNKELTSNR